MQHLGQDNQARLNDQIAALDTHQSETITTAEINQGGGHAAGRRDVADNTGSTRNPDGFTIHKIKDRVGTKSPPANKVITTLITP